MTPNPEMTPDPEMTPNPEMTLNPAVNPNPEMGPAPETMIATRRQRLLTAARDTAGQATAEYALVMLAAAGLAGLLLAWATSTDGVARLMDAVLDSLVGDVCS